jgi:hypothetical protein
MGMGNQRHTEAAFLPGKTRFPLYRRLNGPQSPSGRVRKITPPPGFDPHVHVNYLNLFFFIFFYCCTVHFDNIKIPFTNECRFY